MLLQPLRDYLSGKIDAAANITTDIVPETLQPEPGPAAKKQKLDGKGFLVVLIAHRHSRDEVCFE